MTSMAVNKVNLSKGEVLIDLTQDDIEPEHVQSGIRFHDRTGESKTGTMVSNTKSYELTLAKSSGWVLLTTLDDEVVAHINDRSLVVTLKLLDDYVYDYYCGNTYLVGNTPIGYVNGYPAYGMATRVIKETTVQVSQIFYPANKTDTNISIGGHGMFRLDGNKYYLRPGNGYVYPGTYRLTFTW